MRHRIHLYSEFDDGIDISADTSDTADGVPIVWIRSDNASVSLTFNRDDRAKLRAALDRADAIADKA